MMLLHFDKFVGDRLSAQQLLLLTPVACRLLQRQVVRQGHCQLAGLKRTTPMD